MLPLLTIDTLASVFYATVLHPFPALLTVLSLVALGHSAGSSTFLAAASYLAIVVVFDLLQRLDNRLASGKPRPLDWENEVVVITGGAGGLGGVIATTYGMRGASVAVLDVKPLKSTETDEYEEKGISYYQCDVGDRAQVVSAAAAIERDLGNPTILINNAAVVHGKPVLDLTSNDLDRSYRVNLLAHYHTIQTFLPGVLQRPSGGTIVTISSVLGHLGCAALSDYTAFKAAQTALHNSLTAELTMLAKHQGQKRNPKIYPEQVKTLLVAPGQLSTPLFSRVTSPSAFLGPTVDAKDLAGLVVRLVDRGVSGEASLPLYARCIGLYGVLPGGLRGLVRAWAGLDVAGWRGFVLEGRESGGGLGEER